MNVHMFCVTPPYIKTGALSRFLSGMVLLVLLFAFFPVDSTAQEISSDKPDSLRIIVDDTIPVVDSLGMTGDSIVIHADSLVKRRKPILEAEVSYASDDSLIFSISGQKVYLFDQGVVNYQDIGLSGDYIEFDYNSKVAMAAGALDSTGKIRAMPEFTQGQDKYQFDTMRYNFETKKAIIKSIVTQQGEGYLHSSKTKRLASGEINIKKGKYTTCDYPHPHFYLALTKAISIPGKRTVAGPGYLVFEDIPMPLGLPFGFFPNSNRRASGFLVPEFRDEQRRGFGLENGGWYFAINDYLDVSIVGSIYSRGTWGMKAVSQYLKKYRYSGQFSAQFFHTRINDDPNETDQKDFKVLWSHSQDAKANPTRTFRASVDFATSSFERRQGRSLADVLENRKNSSISYSKRWPGSPFNLQANLNGSQDTRSEQVNLTLPSMNLNMDRIYPFRSKNNTSAKYNWFENIQVSYNARLENRISRIPDSLLFTSNVTRYMQNGFAHSIPISLSNIKILKIISVTPGVSYNGVVFPYYIRKSAVTDSMIFGSNKFHVDTIRKITYAHGFSASIGVSASPKIYGTYTSTRPNSKIIAIRHVMTPRASMSFTPDMKSLVPDYYRQVASSGSAVQPVRYSNYSIYEGQLNSTPTVSGKSGSVSLGLSNTLEMKMRSKKDTATGIKKVPILDNFDFSTSYSPFRDEFKWSSVSMNARSSLFNRNLQIQMSSTLDPYALDSLGSRINSFHIKETGKLFRLTNAQISANFNLRSGAGKKKTTEESEQPQNNYTGGVDDFTDEYDEVGGSLNNREYVDFEIPWSVNTSFTWGYSKSGLAKSKRINSSLRVDGDISITPKWKVGFSTAYDLVAKEFSTTALNVFRDLHCWQMRFGLVPFGTYKSYTFTISAKSAILRDLKWDKRRTWHDNF